VCLTSRKRGSKVGRGCESYTTTENESESDAQDNGEINVPRNTY